MREIAAGAGMHAGNIYYYFANKQELLAFCQEDSLSQLQEMAARVTSEADAPEDQLRGLIVEHVRILNEAIPGSLAHLEIEALEEPWRAPIEERRDAYEATLAEVAENHLRYRAAIDQRPQVRQTTVRASRLRTSRAPTLSEISPYRQALVVSEFEIERVVRGEPLSGTVRVAEWAILDGRSLQLRVDTRPRPVVVELFADNPQLEPVYLSDTLDGNGSPLYYSLD